jgi:hypothetical protein
MEQQFAVRVQDMLNDVQLILNNEIQLHNHNSFNYYLCVIRIIDAFHTEIQDDDNYFKWYCQLMTRHITKLDIDDFIALTTVTPTDFIRMYYWLTFDSFYVDENILFTERQRIILGNQFKRSGLKEELMATLWHPINFNKFYYWDPETFDYEFEGLCPYEYPLDV